jgi:gas vesicle protein
MKQFLLGVLVGIVLGAAGAMIYAELSREPDEAVVERAPGEER